MKLKTHNSFKAFQEKKSKEYVIMADLIKSQLNYLFFHENGNFVIQKCLEIYESDDFDFILDKINKNVRK